MGSGWVREELKAGTPLSHTTQHFTVPTRANGAFLGWVKALPQTSCVPEEKSEGADIWGGGEEIQRLKVSWQKPLSLG